MRMQVFLFGVMFFPVAGAWGQQTASPSVQTEALADSQVYTLHSTVREVSLDIVVTDASRHPAHGLTRDSFRILDDGQPQALRGFEEHNGLKAPAAPEFKLPPNTFTNYVPSGNPEASFVILFDSLDTPVKFQLKEYLQATDFLKDLAPGTSVAIFDLNERMNLVQGFTTDRVLLLNALKDRRAQPKLSPLLGTGSEVWRQQILNDGMMMIGRYLSGFPGRKNLIWFVRNIPGSLNSRTATISSAGAPKSGLTGADVASGSVIATTSQDLQLKVGAATGEQRGTATTSGANHGGQPAVGAQQGGQQTAQPIAGSRDNGQPNGASSENSFQNLTNLIDDSKSTSDVLTLSKVVVYPVDPYELPTPMEISMTDPDYMFEHAAMDGIAEATGGEAFYNRNGLTRIMQEIVAEGSDYYTLTFSPTNAKSDGSYRKLKVQLVGEAAQTVGAGGLRLEYRAGYYAGARQTAKLANESVPTVRGSSGEDFRLVSEQTTGTGTVGSLPRESLQASMTMGQIPPTELILNASIKPSASLLKLAKGETMPNGDFMRDKFKRQPYREYDVLFATDVHGLELPRSTDGLHHGGVEFVAVVYTDQGDVVNSFSVKIALNLREDSYRSLLRNGLGKKHSIAIPTRGRYVIRLGVHDLNSDRVGALEFPLNSVKMTLAGAGQDNTP